MDACMRQNARPIAHSSCSCTATRRVAPVASRVQHHRRLQIPQAGTPDPIQNSPLGNTQIGGKAARSIIKDSTFSFLAKLAAWSFTGAFLIKYGSLLVDLPFQPNAAVATAVVLGTPAVYSVYLLTQGSKQ